MKKRILCIGPTNTPHTLRPVHCLLQHGYEVLLFGGPIDPFKGAHPEGYHFVMAQESFANSDITIDMLTLIKHKFKPDLIHVHWADFRVWQCAMAKLSPVIVSVWGSDLNECVARHANGTLYRTEKYTDIMPTALSTATAIIVDDPFMVQKSNFVTSNSVPVHLNHLGVDDLFFERDLQGEQALRAALRVRPDQKIICSPRAIREDYQHELIIRAFAKVAHETDSVLVIKNYVAQLWTPGHDRRKGAVGRVQSGALDGEGLALQKLATRLGVWQKVRFTDSLSLPELRDLYAISHILVNMPRLDGFPVTFVEAGALGTSVITCAQPAYDLEWVREHFTVLPEATVDCLAAAFSTHLKAPEIKNMALQATIRGGWTHRHYCQKLLALYEQLLAGAPQASTSKDRLS